MLARDMQLGTSLHTWRQRLLALACAVLSAACGHFDEIAGELAHAQGAGSSIVRRNAGMAYRMCREEAAYAYFEMVLGISRQGPVANPAAFGAWYKREPAAQTAAGESQSWEQYCDELDKTGEIYDGAALSLHEYARALGQLARGEDFDGSGLAKLGGSVSSIANAFAPKTSIGSAAKTTGGVVKKLTEVVVELVRTRKLKKLVLRAAPQVTALSAALRDYLDGLEAERKLLQHHRETVLKVSDKRRDAEGGFTPAAQGALVFDLSSEAELRLARYERELTRDRALLLEIAQAHAAVAAAALNKDCERQARRDAARLLQSVQTWEDERSKEH